MQDENIDARRFSIGPIVIAAIISTLTFTWLSWSTFHEHKLAEFYQARAALFERRKAEIIHLDDVLTMSARMGAATANSRWEERYRRFEPRLEAAIITVLLITPEAKPAMTSLQVANDRLVAMENSAFDLIRGGQIEAARTILFSEAYETQKEIYARGINEFIDLVHKQRNAKLSSERKSNNYLKLVLGAAFLLSFAVWINVAFNVKSWRQALWSAKERPTGRVRNCRIPKTRWNRWFWIGLKTLGGKQKNCTLQSLG